MPFTKFTNLDFDQIRTSIKDYLRANSNFTDFDFEGSNFSVLIDTLAYNTYITAFNSNMIVNESFLDSATIRENVVSLARNIGYIPRSRTCSKAIISFDVQVNSAVTSPTITLKAGLVCVGNVNNTSYVFSIPQNITATIDSSTKKASFTNIEVYEGTFLKKEYKVNESLNQKFIIPNPYVDSSTIKVFVKGIGDNGLGLEYFLAGNITEIDKNSNIYLLQEVQDEKYELLFGDDIIGKKLKNNSVITITYIITEGKSGNGATNFSFSGNFTGSSDEIIVPSNSINITTIQSSQNGGDIEPINSIKYFAPRLYSSQYRAVTARDYEAIIKMIYPDAESVSIVGGEELDPPEFGTVLITIKPKNGTYVSDFNKSQILSKLKQYSVSGINQKIIDLKILYVELDSSVYYNYSQTSSVDNLKTNVISSLNTYSESIDLNKFGGRFKYSKIQQIIDNTDQAITSNITKIRIRRDLKSLINQKVQYEICFGNKFHIDSSGGNIKSTGFYISGESSKVYISDIPNKNNDGSLDGSGKGIVSIFKFGSDGQKQVVIQSAGSVDYLKGEIILGAPEYVIITGTEKSDDIIEIQAYPESNDVVGLKDLYIYFDVSKSSINMVKDVIASGDNISGVIFTKDYYTSSYSNGNLTRS
jgi:hypothetical protein